MSECARVLFFGPDPQECGAARTDNTAAFIANKWGTGELLSGSDPEDISANAAATAAVVLLHWLPPFFCSSSLAS